MKRIEAASFKVKCLEIMDEVRSKHETVVITKRGKPVAKLVPADESANSIYGFLAGKGKVVGDVVAPAFSLRERRELEWDGPLKKTEAESAPLKSDPTGNSAKSRRSSHQT
jgi:prevent-host-death family protein